MKLNEEIQRLRADGSSPEAKGRVIQTLQENNNKTTMKLIGKLSIPAALLAAVAVGTMLSVPRAALASPGTVAKAIRNIKNYVINSFTVVDGKRSLSSKTTVANGKSKREFFDAQGHPLAEGSLNALDGALFELVEDKPLNGKGKTFTIKGDRADVTLANKNIEPDTNGAKNQNAKGRDIQIKVKKDGDGKEVKHYFVDGKEVSELPAEVKEKVKVGDNKGDINEIVISDSALVNKVRTSPDNVQGGFAIVGSGSDGKMTMFQSGQTSVDYLLKLLDDPTRWNITRGVSVNGQKLDKLVLSGPASPIELYVDPITSLPKLLKFVGIGQSGLQIEDEYVYEAIKPLK